MVATRLSSGASCAANGAVDIATAGDCEAAAAELGLSDTTACTSGSCTDNVNRPAGCSYSSSVEFLGFNAIASGAACGSQDSLTSGGYFFDCICKSFVSPSPPPPSPPPPSPSP